MKNLEKLSMRDYILESIHDCEPLSKEEENELFLELRNGNIGVRERIIKSNLRLLYKIVSSHPFVNNDNFEDVFQYASLSLMKAVDYFDVDKEYKFSTYAAISIKNAIRKYFFEFNRVIRIPDNVLSKKAKVLEKIDTLLEKGYSLSQISQELNLSIERIIKFFESDKNVLSLSAKFYDGNNETTLEDVLPSSEKGPEDIAIDNSVTKLLYTVIDKCGLSEKEKTVLFSLYCDNSTRQLTKDQVAKILGYSRSGIYFIERSAFRKIRLNKEVLKLAGITSDEESDLNNLKLMKHQYCTYKCGTGAPIGVEDGKIVALKR